MSDRRGGNDFDACTRNGQRILGDGYEQSGFVLELRVLRLHEGLLIGGELRLSGDHVQRRHGADFELLFIVLVKRLVDADGGLFHFHVFAGVDEFPIIVGHLSDGIDDLLSELRLADFHGVARFDNVTIVGNFAKTVQERLRDLHRERGFDKGIKEVTGEIDGRTIAIESDLELRAGAKIPPYS